MTRAHFIALAALALFNPVTLPAAPRQNMGSAFEKSRKPDKKASPAPGEWTPEDRKRLMGEVSGGFYADAMKAKSAGRLNEALTLFQRALILDPANDAARAQIADLKQRLEAGSKPQKAPVKDSAARLMAKLWNDADAAARADNWDEAQANYRKILAIDPGNKRAKTRLDAANARLFEKLKARGEEREKAGDSEGALDAYQLALIHGEDEAVSDRLEKLKSRLAESNRRKSDDIYVQALGASQQGNNDKARVLCKQALAIDRSNIQAQRMLERLETRVR